jgi:phytoene dehydrogenase-like protein
MTRISPRGRSHDHAVNGGGGANGRHTDYDAIVVGGGHNGLTAAAYLAQAGLRVCVLERRGILGGACVTEEVWPGHRVSRASYVVSLLNPKVVRDLRLKDFGYQVHPLDPAYSTLPEEGPPLFFFNDDAQTCASLAQHSRADAEAYPRFQALMERMADFLRPMMLRPPPALGSKHPGDLLGLLREAGRAAGLGRRDVHDFYRVMTMSVGDLLDDWFESDLFKGASASTGVVGVWAGPRTPGTAYNLLHHELGEIDGVPGLWGHVKGGMGAISMAIARSAEASGAVIRTDADVRAINVRDGHTTGVTLASGEELTAPVVMSGAHPKTTVLDLVGAEHFPDEVGEDMRRYKTRGGSVKVNWVLSEPPRYERFSEQDQARLLRSGVAFCPSVDFLERAWQDACRGKPSEQPYLEVEVPTTIDPTLTDDGTTIMTMFTQYGPPDEAGWPEGAREAYAQRCLEQVARHAPNVLDAVVHYEVLAPPDLERIFGLVGGSIFQGEQGLDQMAFMRPSPLLSQYSTPVDGLYLCGAGTHPGGGVMAVGGHNAAHRVLHDQRWKRARQRVREVVRA